MKLLVLTRSAWDEANSTGNTLSNILGDWPAEDISNVYLRAARPRNSVCESYFSISEGDLLRSLFRPASEAGASISLDPGNGVNAGLRGQMHLEATAYRLGRRLTSGLLRSGREWLWEHGRWGGKALTDFVREASPDVIFSPAFGARYPHNVLWRLAAVSGASVALYHCDDHMRALQDHSRHGSTYSKSVADSVLDSARRADLNFAITPQMADKYASLIGRPVEVLVKGGNFDPNRAPWVRRANEPLSLVYAGNLLHGRWRSLLLLIQVLSELNAESTQAMLRIYSQYPPSGTLRSQLDVPGTSEYCGSLSADEVDEALMSADIVLHAESLDERERQETALSFSTKIIDLLGSRRCVMGIGSPEAASISYLRDCPGALVANSIEDIRDALEPIMRNPALLQEMSERSFAHGADHHSLKDTRDFVSTRLAELAMGTAR